MPITGKRRKCPKGVARVWTECYIKRVETNNETRGTLRMRNLKEIINEYAALIETKKGLETEYALCVRKKQLARDRNIISQLEKEISLSVRKREILEGKVESCLMEVQSALIKEKMMGLNCRYLEINGSPHCAVLNTESDPALILHPCPNL